MPQGIMERYKVVDRQTGDEVPGLFVIDPIRDPHARAGLMAYARSVESKNAQLANDLVLYVFKLEITDSKSQNLISGSTHLPDWLTDSSNDEHSDNGSASNSRED